MENTSKKPPRRFTCRVCGWQVPAWFLADWGRIPTHGGEALQEHFQVEHPEEYKALQRRLDDEFGEEGLPE